MEKVKYMFDFSEQKKKFSLQDHWLVYKNKICPKCAAPLQLPQEINEIKNKIISFFCGNCQSLFKR
ncbi:MAG TPA: hypothetical protein VFF27_03690 [Bacteroidia bacterium]|jgi:RNase P subunit RPR2|nr:hypothetical protein [Bacteroidia bacterium]